MADLQIPPGRYLVEVRPDDFGSFICRIDERGHVGDPGPVLHIPGIHAWFDQQHKEAIDRMTAMLRRGRLVTSR